MFIPLTYQKNPINIPQVDEYGISTRLNLVTKAWMNSDEYREWQYDMMFLGRICEIFLLEKVSHHWAFSLSKSIWYTKTIQNPMVLDGDFSMV